MKTRQSLFRPFIACLVIACLQGTGDAQAPKGTCSIEELTVFANRELHFYQYLLGRRYYEGSGGVTRNPATAIEWFFKSARNGGDAAKIYLSACYRDGDGVSKDAYYSRELFDKYLKSTQKEVALRVSEGNATAKAQAEGIYHYLLGELYYRRGGMGSKEAAELAIDELILASKVDNPESLILLAICYKDGSGTSVDEEASKQLFDRYLRLKHESLQNLADTGDTEAISAIKCLYYSELGNVYWDHGHSWCIADQKRAVECLEKASQLGDPRSMTLLSICYKDGYGVAKNEEKSRSFWNASQRVYAERQKTREQRIDRARDAFLDTDDRSVSSKDLKSGKKRWELIDHLIGFESAPTTVDRERAKRLKEAITEHVNEYEARVKELVEFEQMQRAFEQRQVRLSAAEIRQKVAIQDKIQELVRVISRDLGEVSDKSFIKAVVAKTGSIPGGDRALKAANSKGVYSYEHICALLWQSRNYSDISEQPIVASELSTVLSQVRAYRSSEGNNGAAPNVDSERLLVAGLLTHEVSNILRTRRSDRLNDDDKTLLKNRLKECETTLRDAAAEEASESADKSERATKTRDALAFSWNLCLKLVEPVK